MARGELRNTVFRHAPVMFPASALHSPGDPAVSRALRCRARWALLATGIVYIVVVGGLIAALVTLDMLENVRVRRAGFICSVGFSLLWMSRLAFVSAPLFSAQGHSKGALDSVAVECESCKDNNMYAATAPACTPS